MEPKLQIFLMIVSIVFTSYIFFLVKKETLEIKYTLAWCFTGILLVLMALKPSLIYAITELLGIVLPVNAVFLLGILCILVILFTLTVAISRTSVRTKRLAQEIAIMNLELEKLRNLNNNIPIQ